MYRLNWLEILAVMAIFGAPGVFLTTGPLAPCPEYPLDAADSPLGLLALAATTCTTWLLWLFTNGFALTGLALALFLNLCAWLLRLK